MTQALKFFPGCAGGTEHMPEKYLITGSQDSLVQPPLGTVERRGQMAQHCGKQLGSQGQGRVYRERLLT